MDNVQVSANDLIDVLKAQRNNAFDAVAMLECRVKDLEKQLQTANDAVRNIETTA